MSFFQPRMVRNLSHDVCSLVEEGVLLSTMRLIVPGQVYEIALSCKAPAMTLRLPR
jgi:hypothetical protein